MRFEKADHPPGGLSYLSESYGLACDNVINFEVRLFPHSDIFTMAIL